MLEKIAPIVAARVVVCVALGCGEKNKLIEKEVIANCIENSQNIDDDKEIVRRWNYCNVKLTLLIIVLMY